MSSSRSTGLQSTGYEHRKRIKDAGTSVYEADVKGPDGQCSEVKVADDGKLLKYKTKMHHDKQCTKGK